jgi:hypothetical protein
MSRDQNAGRSQDIKTYNCCSERVEQFRYFGITLTNQNSIQEESITTRMILTTSNIMRYSVEADQQIYLSLHVKVGKLEQCISKCTPDLEGSGYRTRYNDSLRAGRFGDGIPVEARFPHPSREAPRPTQPPNTMRTDSFPG